LQSLSSKLPKYQQLPITQNSPYLQQIRSPTKPQPNPFNACQDSYGRPSNQGKITIVFLIPILILARSPTKVQPSQIYQDSPYAKPPPSLPAFMNGSTAGISSGLNINRRLLGNKAPSNQNITSFGTSYQFRKVERSAEALPPVLPPLQTQSQQQRKRGNQKISHKIIFG
jgi:hypothetical protein